MPGERELCIVVAGGDAPDPEAVARLEWPEDAFVIAADSGVDHALTVGLHVDVAVGDFDSVTAQGLDDVIATGARVERHPAAKDHTDLELALDEALASGAHDVIVLGGDGGRRDHLFANFLVLASPQYGTCRITAYLGRSRVHILHGGQAVQLAGEHGELVSLLPVHGPAEGVRTSGLRYPLRGETLPPGTTRGVSNVLETPPAEVQMDAGSLAAVLPGEQEGGEA